MTEKRRNGIRRGPIAVALLLAVAACSSEDASPPVHPEARESIGPLEVYVVNDPLRAMAERIGGEGVRVRLPAPPGVDPADWQPDADAIAAYQGADLIVLNGAGYAEWVAYATLPRSRLLDTAAAFRDRWVPVEGAVTHAHGRGATHAHEGYEATTWLDPILAIEQARAIEAALARLRVDDQEAFAENLAALEIDLLALDARLAAAAERIGDAPLLFSHPVYGYLVRRYGLNARALHWEPGEVPGDAGWRELDRVLEAHPARWMLWEAAPREESRVELRARGVESAVFAPGGGAAAEGDFLTLMGRNAAELERVATGPAP